MKIKLKDLINAFPGIRGCYDVCEFARVVDLMPHYREVKDIVTLYDERKKALEEELQKGADKDGNLTGKQVKEHNDKLAAIHNEEIDLKSPPKFKPDEAKKALGKELINGSQYEAMEPYFVAKESKTKSPEEGK
jgi:hypothetical protein